MRLVFCDYLLSLGVAVSLVHIIIYVGIDIDRYLFYLAKLAIKNMIMQCPARANSIHIVIVYYIDSQLAMP